MTFFSSGGRGRDDGDVFATRTVEAQPDKWTAEISRTETSETGDIETALGFVEVGSISNLISAVKNREKEEEGRPAQALANG